MTVEQLSSSQLQTVLAALKDDQRKEQARRQQEEDHMLEDCAAVKRHSIAKVRADILAREGLVRRKQAIVDSSSSKKAPMDPIDDGDSCHDESSESEELAEPEEADDHADSEAEAFITPRRGSKAEKKEQVAAAALAKAAAAAHEAKAVKLAAEAA